MGVSLVVASGGYSLAAVGGPSCQGVGAGPDGGSRSWCRSGVGGPVESWGSPSAPFFALASGPAEGALPHRGAGLHFGAT